MSRFVLGLMSLTDPNNLYMIGGQTTGKMEKIANGFGYLDEYGIP